MPPSSDDKQHGKVGATTRARLVRAVTAALAPWPLPVLHRVGAGLGTLVEWFPSTPRMVATMNLERCFPDAGGAERRAMRRAHFRELGKTVMEAPALMRRGPERVQGWVVETDGEETFHRLAAQGRGVILAAPHLGSWEVIPHWVLQHYPMRFLYRPPRQRDLGPMLLEARARSGGQPVETTPRGVRILLQGLRKGEIVGILPDQEPDGNEPFAPFFGHPAKTMTLLSRLAARSGAPVIFGWAERLPAGRGFRLRFRQGEEAIASSDLQEAAAALNRGVEACVREAPAQYQWSYKRFDTQPDGTRFYPRGKDKEKRKGG